MKEKNNLSAELDTESHEKVLGVEAQARIQDSGLAGTQPKIFEDEATMQLSLPKCFSPKKLSHASPIMSVLQT